MAVSRTGDAMRPHYERALREAADFKVGAVLCGVGLAAGAFGIGGPGDNAIAALELDDDGGVTVYAAAPDPGEGTDSMLTQLTAKNLNLPLNKVRLVTRDTDRTTATGPAAASRITFMVGGAVLDAINQLKATMAEVGEALSPGNSWAVPSCLTRTGLGKTLRLVRTCDP